MALTPGVRFGPYEIHSALGAGGMGEVYRARDTKLDRDVALKLLPADVANDPDRLRRFELEARAASGLNHPAIVAIYDLGQVESQPYISMELVDGRTLRRILETEPMPPRRVLQVAAPIADGLAKAHEAGIVHRDLKPENLMVSHDGFAKILDFGLAKLAGDAESGAALQTRTNQGTRPGIAMGTIGYMSPEQASGGVADSRSDLFSFGLVLYEMLTGQRAFTRPTAVETLSAIIREDPPSVAELNPSVPAPVQWIVDRCLAKAPSDRYGSTRDLARDLAAARDHFSQLMSSAGTAVTDAVGPRARFGGRELLAWALVVTLVLAGLALLLLRPFGYRAAGPAPTVRFFLEPPKDVTFASNFGAPPFAVSPDGRHLAFNGIGADKRRRLWLRSLDSIDSRPIPGTEGAFGAFWSPDGLHIGFFTQDSLKRVSVAGGDAVVICKATFGAGATWNRDGVIVFAPELGDALFRVTAEGGTPAPLTTLDRARGESAHLGPVFLPDGRHFVFTMIATDVGGIYVASLDSPERKRVSPDALTPGFSSPDVLFFLQDSTLMAQRIDLKRFDLIGEPRRIAEGVDRIGPAGAFAVSQSGTLVSWTGSRTVTQPTWFERDGTAAGTLGPPAPYMNLALSHDGQYAAVDRFDATPGIWLLDRARGTTTRATFGGAYRIDAGLVA